MAVRIIAGKFKGFSIKVPNSARPTLLRARQSLFDMLESMASERGNFFSDKTILDCFAGSGAFGFEALSRGAGHACFIDIDKKAASLLHSNAIKLGVENFSTIIHSDVKFLKKCYPRLKSCDIVFLDPPYGKLSIANTLVYLLHKGWMTDDTLVITEENTKKTEILDKYLEVTRKIYGTSIFRILRRNSLDFV